MIIFGDVVFGTAGNQSQKDKRKNAEPEFYAIYRSNHLYFLVIKYLGPLILQNVSLSIAAFAFAINCLGRHCENNDKKKFLPRQNSQLYEAGTPAAA